MNHLWQDIRYGVRMLAGKPGFTVAAVLVLALGIGANSAVFSLVNAFLLKPLAVQKPEELTGLFSRDSRHPDVYRAFSYPNYVDIRDNSQAFSSLAALNMALVGIQEGETTRRTLITVVSSNYFSMLGVMPLKGRAFLPQEEKPGGELTAIVTYPFWKKNGEDPQLVGKPVRINGHLFTIVGITPPGFTGSMALLSPEIFVPLSAYGLVMNDFEGHLRPLAARDNNTLILLGRLKPGVTPQAADAMLAVAAARMEQAYPAENKDQTLLVRPLARLGISTNPQSDSTLKAPAIMLLSLAGVVLLIASLNLANMMMAKGTARRKEIAIRLAIGGSRRRIVRQLATEGFLLAILGGAAGLLVASWSTTALTQSMARLAPIEIVYDSTPDARVLGFTLLFCILSTVVFGLFPAWKLSKPDVSADLKENSGEDVGGRKRRLFSRGNMLVMAQLSLSLAMLTAAGLFVHSAVRAANIQPGFSLENEVLAEVDASLIDYDQARASHLYAALKDRLRQVPGVQSVAIAATVPFGSTRLGKSVTPSGSAATKEHPALETRYNIVSEDYFQTLGISVLRGRPFTAAESTEGSKTSVAIIDQLAADKLWPSGDAVGKHIRMDERGKQARDAEIVGVVGNIREDILGGKIEPHLYLPFGQEFQSDVQFHVKLGGGPEAEHRALESVRHEILAADARLPIVALKTMREHLDSGLDIWIVRTGAQVLEIFGSVALFLAVIGLYALNSYTVARRTREIGIRMALGADASSTLRM
ncbi:MAG TPA: ABC transporter permease, partial [Bryobacteraceae bacterium]|nr:ABC transporter permease [Bryobacteraceae bacterium]